MSRPGWLGLTAHMCDRGFILGQRTSEDELHAELNVTRVISLRGYQTKRAGVVWVESDPVSKIGMVECIQRLRTELQLPLLAEIKVLRNRKVDIQERLVAQIVQRGGNVAQARVEIVEPEDARGSKSRDVNAVLLTLRIACAGMALNLGYVTSEVPGLSGAEQKRFTALPLVCAIDLPSADGCINETVHVIAQQLAATHRQFVNGGEGEPIRSIIRRDAIFQITIGWIQVVQLLSQPRASVRSS